MFLSRSTGSFAWRDTSLIFLLGLGIRLIFLYLFRFSAIPLSVLLVFVPFGWQVISERSRWSRRTGTEQRRILAGDIAFTGLLAALVFYAAIPLSKLNTMPEYRDASRVAGILRANIASSHQRKMT